MDRRGPLHNVGPQVTLGDRVVTVSEAGVSFTRLPIARTEPGATVTEAQGTLTDARTAVTGPGLAIAEHQVTISAPGATVTEPRITFAGAQTTVTDAEITFHLHPDPRHRGSDHPSPGPVRPLGRENRS